MTTERMTDDVLAARCIALRGDADGLTLLLAEEAARARRVEQEQAGLIKRLAENERANGGKVWGRAGWHTYYCHARSQCDDNCRLTQELLRAAGMMVEPEARNG